MKPPLIPQISKLHNAIGFEDEHAKAQETLGRHYVCNLGESTQSEHLITVLVLNRAVQTLGQHG